MLSLVACDLLSNSFFKMEKIEILGMLFATINGENRRENVKVPKLGQHPKNDYSEKYIPTNRKL